jgi:hypothetical protein
MSYSQIVKTLRDGATAFADNGGAHTLSTPFEIGNMTLNIPGPEVLLFLLRNRVTSPPLLRYGKDRTVSGSFDCMLRDFDDADTTIYMIEQFLLKGAIDGWTSTMGTAGEVFTTTMTFSVAGTIHGDASNNTLTLPYTHISGQLKEGDPTMLTFNFDSFVVFPTVS